MKIEDLAEKLSAEVGDEAILGQRRLSGGLTAC